MAVAKNKAEQPAAARPPSDKAEDKKATKDQPRPRWPISARRRNSGPTATCC